MTDYKKAWEDSAKYAHKLELENANLKQQFEAELNAAKNDYKRYKKLKAKKELWHREWNLLADFNDKLVEENEELREGVQEAYIEGALDYCRRESLVREDIDVPDTLKENNNDS